MALSIVDTIFTSWWTPIICLLLYSISWFRGDAQRNIKKYARWDKIRLNQKTASRQDKRLFGKKK